MLEHVSDTGKWARGVFGGHRWQDLQNGMVHSDEQPLAPAQQLYGELYAYRLFDGNMIRLTDNKWEEGMASWEAPLPRD